MFNPLRPDYANTPAHADRPEFPFRCDSDGSNPAVSLITAFYNTGPEFGETVRSVLRQTLANMEWIVVNDGSTDPEAVKVLTDFRAATADDPRIRILDLEQNVGVSAARNRGVDAAQAEFVAFVDSDDLLEPTAIEKWAWFLATHPDIPWANSQIVGFGAFEYHWLEGFHMPEKFLERNAANPHGIYRKAFFEQVGGHDESIRDGLEDWEFWMRCASLGHWGATVKDPLIWYRRRNDHSDRWDDFDEDERSKAFGERLRSQYPALWEEGYKFPIPNGDEGSNHPLVEDLPINNSLTPIDPKSGSHNLLALLPHMEMGGSDKFNLDLFAALIDPESDHAWRITVATTRGKDGGSWLQELGSLTPDVFVLGRFLEHADWPRFLHYLIRSRGIDTVLVSHSIFGYQVLSYLQARCPDVRFVDYLHIEMEGWKAGGYPRFAAHYSDSIDRTMTSSEHLKNWVVERGGDANRIEVCTTNIDPNVWNPSDSSENYDRANVATEFGFDASPERCLILFAGRLVEQKQPRLLMEVALELAKTRSGQFQLIIAGDGDDGPWVRNFFESHRADLKENVVLLGEVPNDDIKRLLAVTDVFFLPSEHEGIALSLFEAMAMESVVVGAVCGGQPELVTDQCGTLIARENFDQERNDYVEALGRWIADPEGRREAAKAARQRICEDFQLDAMVTQMSHALVCEPAAPIRNPNTAMSEQQLLRYTMEICEQARLEDKAQELWLDNLKLRDQRQKLRDKVENFRGMIARRDEKIESIKNKSSSSADGGSFFGNLTRKLKRVFGK